MELLFIFNDLSTIELVGYWILVTGNTFAVKAVLKEAGFLFASKKLAWYFRTGEYKVNKGGKKSLDEIRSNMEVRLSMILSLKTDILKHN